MKYAQNSDEGKSTNGLEAAICYRRNVQMHGDDTLKIICKPQTGADGPSLPVLCVVILPFPVQSIL